MAPIYVRDGSFEDPLASTRIQSHLLGYRSRGESIEANGYLEPRSCCLRPLSKLVGFTLCSILRHLLVIHLLTISLFEGCFIRDCTRFLVCSQRSADVSLSAPRVSLQILNIVGRGLILMDCTFPLLLVVQ